tara:strand:+ start:101 stop:367 length:267 start_codon:yes stop_codon:yes gene_type:complete
MKIPTYTEAEVLSVLLALKARGPGTYTLDLPEPAENPLYKRSCTRGIEGRSHITSTVKVVLKELYEMLEGISEEMDNTDINNQPEEMC